MEYPRRLIEVDLPIRRISAHARREKSLRHGNISTLHIWWARRPLAACRAVICAALWPDPEDPLCAQSFRTTAQQEMRAFAKEAAGSADIKEVCGEESWQRWMQVSKSKFALTEGRLRGALLDFIADFSAWEASASKPFLRAARALTDAAHVALGGTAGTRPLVVDPFAGGGSIPLEALRVGADTFAGDLNPVAVLLNKIVLEFIPRHGPKLAEEVRRWGQWVKAEAEKELAEFYPKDRDGSTPIAYLWARTVTCEGPGCGAEVPLMRGLWLSKRGRNSRAVKLLPKPRAKRVDFEIITATRAAQVGPGTVARGAATCPCCGFTTPVESVRKQLKKRAGGAADARLFCVVTTKYGTGGRSYRLPTKADLEVVERAAAELVRRRKVHRGDLPLVPEEPTPRGGGSGAGRAFSQRNYGMEVFGDLFAPRQLLALTTLARLVRAAGEKIASEGTDTALTEAVQVLLACAVDRMADKNASLTVWNTVGEKIEHVFGRQALPMAWDFPEVGIFSNSTGNWLSHVEFAAEIAEASVVEGFGICTRADATATPQPDRSAAAFITDPPYYDAVPYADLSDFFYVWLKRTLPTRLARDFTNELSPKEHECIVDEVKGKDKEYFEKTMQKAMAEGRRVIGPSGIGTVVFAHKTTAGWEAQLKAMVEAGWVVTGSWPIDTERPGRLRAQNSAALASSIHLVCRPRDDEEHPEVGDWRDVLDELPKRIHQWLPRLAEEGVVGADAIFACLGPALEVFSRYSRVEKVSGESVGLGEYLTHVWGAVAKEAVGMIFSGGDASGFEEDARLTAMWLWTLSAAGTNGSAAEEEEDSETAGGSEKKAPAGFTLEYDAARKIAQGLGAHLDSLPALVEVRGENARLLSVAERATTLFGKGQLTVRAASKRPDQLKLFEELADDEESGVSTVSGADQSFLDRLHRAMILFAAGRGEALKRFLVEGGAGADQQFWRLAQALSALYPPGSDEKRWVDGVMARKKSLGL